MGRTLADLFAEIASRANSFDEPVLAHLCRMAAVESRRTVIPWDEETKPDSVGIFDWDVANDINHLDPIGAEFFGVDAAKAGRGLPNHRYIGAIHPDDMCSVNAFLLDCMKGGVAEASYRIISSSQPPRWIFAKGFCTLDKSNRPERFAGMMRVVRKKMN
jgi:PAS domain-containing protein